MATEEWRDLIVPRPELHSGSLVLFLSVLSFVGGGCHGTLSAPPSDASGGSSDAHMSAETSAVADAKPLMLDAPTDHAADNSSADVVWIPGSDTSAVCSSLRNVGSIIAESVNLTSPLQDYLGGTIVDGTYVLTAIDVWMNGVTSQNLGTTQRTIRIGGNGTEIDLAFHSVDEYLQVMDVLASGALSTSGTNFHVQYNADCSMGSAGFTVYYSAGPDWLVLFYWDSLGRAEWVSTYRFVGNAVPDAGSSLDSGNRS